MATGLVGRAGFERIPDLLYNNMILTMFMSEEEKIIYLNEKSQERGTGEVYNGTLKAHRNIIRTFRSRFNAQKRWYHRFADAMTEKLGNIWFFIINLLWFLLWMIWNSPWLAWLPKFDPYPYNFLTMIVSLEAIFLSIIVLISQNRQSSIADMREEIDFNINVRAEREITKILKMLEKIQNQLGVEEIMDEELLEMEKDTDLDEIEQQIVLDYDRSEEE